MALWLQDQEYDALPLGQYQASRGEYLSAVADEAWQSNPLPSLLRWNERLRADYGQLGGTLRTLGAFLPLGRETAEAGFRELGAPDSFFQPRSPWLTIEEVHDRGKALGLKATRGMSEEAFASIADERRRKLAADAIYQRARLNEGYGPGLAALSVALEFAVSAADPLNIATAFLPFARLPGLAGLVARVPAGGARRIATGAIEGGLGNLAVEPAVALAATDEDPNYGWTNALLTLAFGVGLGGGLHWLGGKFSDRYVRGEPERSPPSARTVLEGRAPQEPASGAAPVAAGERAGVAPGETSPVLAQGVPDVPQRTAAAVEALHPETRQALMETALKQAGNDLATDVHPLAAMDRAWRPFRAPTSEPAFRLGGWDEAQIKRELAEQRTLLADLAQMAGDAGARLKAPAGWEPTPALLKQAKAYIRPPKVTKEPQRLAQMVRAEGGLNIASVEAQNLKAMDLGPLSGLLRKRRAGGVKDMQGAKQQLGKGVDELIDNAMAAGFYHGERPDAAKFISDLIDDAQGDRPVYAMGRDQPDLGEFDMTTLERKRWEQGMEAHPLGDPRSLAPKDLAYYLSLDPIERRLAELEDLQARGVISEAESTERAAMMRDAILADEEAAARELAAATVRVPEGFEKDLEALRAPEEYQPLTEAEAGRPWADLSGEATLRQTSTEGDVYALAERSGLPAAPPETLPGGAGRSGPAGSGEERGAPGALSQSAEPAAAGALPGTGAEAYQAQGSLSATFDRREFDLWLQRQADWRADAHAEPAAAERATAVIDERQALTPERDLAELEASVGKLLDAADKEDLKAVTDAHAEARAMVDAYTACRAGGGR